MEEQDKAKNEAITEKVIKAIKEKREIVRHTVEKKEIGGSKSSFMPIRHTREKEERKAVEQVIEAG